MSGLLYLILAMWIGLAIVTGFHASGRNRSGIAWFFAVGIGGIFGFAAYLLAITAR